MDAETRHTLARFLARSYVRVIRFRLHSSQRNREKRRFRARSNEGEGRKISLATKTPDTDDTIDGSIDGFNLTRSRASRVAAIKCKRVD